MLLGNCTLEKPCIIIINIIIIIINPCIKFDLEKLNDPEIASVFKDQIGGRFAALNLPDSSVEELAGDFKEVVLETAEEILGRWRKKIQPWVTNDILDLCDKDAA